MSGSVIYKIVTDDSEAFALEGEWRALHDNLGDSVFTDFDWFAIWRRTVGHAGKRRLHIITGREDGKLTALLPLVVMIRQNFRVLQPIGIEAFYQCDLLCKNDAQAEGLWMTALRSPHYDYGHIRDAISSFSHMRTLEKIGRAHAPNPEICLNLTGVISPGAWKKTLSKQYRRNVDKGLRLLKEQGEVKYEICKTTPVPKHVIKRIVDLKTAWCLENGQKGMFDQPHILDYYQQMAETCAKNGSLALAWMTCGEAIVACHLMYMYKETVYSYTMAVDPHWLKYSPGHLIHVMSISWAIENGFTLFNHMQGDFAYKHSFSNEVRICREYTFHRSLRGKLGQNLFIARRAAGKYLRKKFAQLKTPKAA
jgi:CelD/BcsL family acetyltransferase involved in cellulose biosynthesis